MLTNAQPQVAVAVSKPKAVGPGGAWQIVLNLDRVVFCTSDEVTESCLASPGGVPLFGWQHVVVTWDGTTKRTYLNAEPVATEAATTTFDDTPRVLAPTSRTAS